MRDRLNPLLAVCLVLCSLLLVNSQHQARRLFIEQERVQEKNRQLEVQAKELELKQSTLGQHARIESSAKRELNMVALTQSNVLYLTAETK